MSLAQRLANFPTPAGGLALGIASLGWVWQTELPEISGIQALAALVAAAIAVPLVAKFVLNPRMLMTELAHPVVGSVIPTLAMAAMVVSVSLGKLIPGAGVALWLAAVAAHLVFLCVFTLHRARDPHLSHMVPSWFVPPIGIVVAVIAVPNAEWRDLAHAFLVFGIAAYAVMLPAMLHRLIFRDGVAAPAKPTIAIMAAPPNLCLAGYLSFTADPNLLVTVVLLGLGILMAVVVYIGFWELLRLPFSPGYAAFTFPTVIAANATFKAAAYFEKAGIAPDAVAPLRQWGMVELAIATVVVAYVALRYIGNYAKVRRRVPALTN